MRVRQFFWAALLVSSCSSETECVAYPAPPCEYPNATGRYVRGACEMKDCLRGYGDCNEDSIDGCEADLLVDAAHCGACGNACPATTCQRASCWNPTVLADNRPDVFDLAVHGEQVFWVESGGRIMTVSPASENPVVLADKQVNAYALATDGVHVYWTNLGEAGIDPTPEVGAGTILGLPVEGGIPRVIAGYQPTPFDITTDGQALYWTFGPLGYPDGRPGVAAPSGIARYPLDQPGAHPTVVQSGLEWVYRIALTDTHLYWLAADDRIRRAALFDWLAEDIVADSKPMAFAVQGTDVCWIDATEGVFCLDTAADELHPIAPGSMAAGDIVVDRDWVFWWEEATGMILRSAKRGGDVLVLAGQEFGNIRLALGTDKLVWVRTHGGTITREGAIMAVSKTPE